MLTSGGINATIALKDYGQAESTLLDHSDMEARLAVAVDVLHRQLEPL